MKDSQLLALIERTKEGNETAFQTIYEYYQPKVYFIALKITGNHADAQDMMQETFLQVYTSIKHLKEPLFFKSWMTKIMISKCNRMFQKSYTIIVDPEILYDSIKMMEYRNYMLPKETFWDKQTRHNVLYLISQLTPAHQEVLLLYYFCDLKQSEIADLLKLNINSVKSRLARSKRCLRNIVDAYKVENI